MAKKRTKADRLERQTEQLDKRLDRRPDDVNEAADQTTLAPKSDEPTVLIPIEQQIQQRAYELYEQRGRTVDHNLDDWLQAEREIKGRQAKRGRHSFRQSSKAVDGSARLVVSEAGCRPVRNAHPIMAGTYQYLRNDARDEPPFPGNPLYRASTARVVTTPSVSV